MEVSCRVLSMAAQHNLKTIIKTIFSVCGSNVSKTILIATLIIHLINHTTMQYYMHHNYQESVLGEKYKFLLS